MAISSLEEISCHQDTDMHVHRNELYRTDRTNETVIILYSKRTQVQGRTYSTGTGYMIDEYNQLHPALPFISLFSVQQFGLENERVATLCDQVT